VDATKISKKRLSAAQGEAEDLSRRASARADPFHADLLLWLNQVELWFSKIELE